ncbi:DNA/RNA helicase domain-containing protein [Providencia vermicola]|uniref:DNA/RNA helicase domain-containing protein n=1 Tax=Providencia vermicola TaxID=333965 RepID=UPI0032DB58D4
MEPLAGWSGTWDAFFNVNEESFVSQLITFHASLPWTDQLSDAQKEAWFIEHEVMKRTLKHVCEVSGFSPDKAWIAFEQELVGEGGKRAADVNLVLPTGDLFVVEFKHKLSASDHEIWRVRFDLKTMLRFHSESIGLEGRCFLALTKPGATGFKHDSVTCDIPENGVLPSLSKTLTNALIKPQDAYDVLKWQNGSFYRQPSILHGTVQVFFEETIPTLKTSAGENIEDARTNLLKLYGDAKTNRKRYVVVVHGRPGAGKTLLGISAVANLVNTYGAEQCKPVFLSGNGPLVQVLQYTLDYHGKRSNKDLPLDGRVLIEDLSNFKRTLKQHERWNEIEENFVVFDEAQRAWEKLNSRDVNSESELHLFCDWLAQKDFGVLVLLVGDGQAIYRNEMSLENMLLVLEDAIYRHRARITAIMPELHTHHLKKVQVCQRDVFNLKMPIRQAYTEELDRWIEAVLGGNTQQANSVATLLKLDYPLMLTQSKSAADSFAREHMQTLHQDNIKLDAFRMGWLMSSQGGPFIPEVKAKNGNLVGPWYVEKPESHLSCCQLNTACTEFASQGLELSLALLNWGNDLVYRNGQLRLSQDPSLRRTQAHYTSGSYRVLLSRGRNGLIIKCDDDETFEFLKKTGMCVL